MNAEIDPKIVTRLRQFFTGQGFIEVFPQAQLSILAACEDPTTVVTTKIGGILWPLPQTNQMHLEHTLLQYGSDHPGLFCLTTSYRDEQNVIPGRHDLVFPMFEFEAPGTMADLLQLERDLIEALGFDTPTVFNYEEACIRFGVDEIAADQERRLGSHGPVLIQYFPTRSQPFWNMRSHDETGLYCKIDVILGGMETIGSAERETDPDLMRKQFDAVSGGRYALLLKELFSLERVQAELDEYLALRMFPRFGGGIGLTRLQSALRRAGLLPESAVRSAPKNCP